jgi:hypothetical protein
MATTSVDPASRSAADRIARQVLRLDGVEPKALMSLKGSLLISAVRCVIVYALVPALAPLLGASGALATPVSLLMSLVAAVLAVHSLRRVWLADWTHRWAYTAFIGLVLAALTLVIVLDVRTLVT